MATGVTVGDAGALLSTGDGGATWTSRENGAGAEMLDLASTDSLHAWAVGTFGNTQYTTDGGANWTSLVVGNPFGHLYGVDFLNASRGWLVGDGDQSNNYGVIYRSTNGGKAWGLQFSGGSLTQMYDVDAINSSTAVAVGNLGIIWRTTDGGLTWQQVPHPSVTSVLSGVEFKGKVGYVTGNSGAILKSRTGGPPG